MKERSAVRRAWEAGVEVTARLRVVRWALGGGLIGATVALVLPRPYVATVTVMPDAVQRPALSVLSGLGSASEALLGRESIKFYADLFRSRELAESVLRSGYRLETGTEVTLLEFWGGGSSDTARRIQKARKKLVGRTAVAADPSTGLIRIAVRASQKGLATQIMRRYVEALQDFNQRRRTSRARAEREFLGRRVDEISAELDAAERALERFYEANRRLEGSPRLVFQETKLRRRVELVQAVYAGVMRSYEEARLNEVRDTPIITVIDRPQGSEERVPSRAPLLALVGVIAAVGTTLLFVHRGVPGSPS